MKNRDLVSSIFWLAFGAVFAVGGLQLGLVRQGIPGPGSLPFIVGLALIGLSLILLFQVWRSKPAPGEKIFLEWITFHKFALSLAALVAYALLLKTLGFTLTTFLFLFFVLRFVGREKWVTAFVFSISAALVSYTLFTSLQVNLPAGRLGF
jgi:putative tricarboxylic transport membrane protein